MDRRPVREEVVDVRAGALELLLGGCRQTHVDGLGCRARARWCHCEHADADGYCRLDAM
jgi:hypothetical protein